MKKLYLALVLAFAVCSVSGPTARAATGDVTVAVNVDAWTATISVAGFSSSAVYDWDWRGQIPGTFVSGIFTNGETVTQNNSGVTAKVVGAQSSGTFLLVKSLVGSAPNDALRLPPQAAATASSNSLWVGQSSGATFKPKGAPLMTIPGPNTPFFTVVRQGYTGTTLGTVTDTVYISGNVNVPYSTATIGGTFTAGSVADNVTLTQGTTSATAITVGAQATGSLLRVKKVTGSPDNSHTWTGGGLTFTPNATPTTLTLPVVDELAPTGSLTVRVSLNDYIYAGDNTPADATHSGTAPLVTFPAGVITSGGTPNNALSAASVTQSSTLTYPNALVREATFPYKLLTGAFTTEVQAFHRHARNGQPVAAVKFTYSDGTITPRTQTITAMTLSTDSDQLPVYAAADTASNFTQGANVVRKVEVYPWVGNATNVFDSSANTWAATDMKMSNLPVGVCDKTGAYAGAGGGTFCGFDATNGSDSNTTAYSTQTAAEAGLKTATMGKAFSNIRAFNNSNYSRNTVDAGVALMYGTNNLFGEGGNTMGTNTAVAATIKPASTETRASAIITGFNATSRYGPTVTRLYNVTVAASNSSNQLFAFVHNGTSPILIEDCIFTGTNAGTAPLDGDSNGKATGMWKNTTMSGYTNGIEGSSSGINLLARTLTISGATSGAFKQTRAVMGCTINGDGSSGDTMANLGLTTSGWTETGNRIFSYNKYLNENGAFLTSTVGSATNINVAIVCNLMERVGTTGVAMIELSAAPISNVFGFQNSSPGDRVNLEGDVTGGAGTGTDYTYTYAAWKYNSWYYNGTHNQGDAHAQNGLLVGQWPYSQYCVGWSNNNGEVRNQENYSFPGKGSTNQTLANYVSDKSRTGTVAIPGSYTSGTFTNGEVVSQATTGALAYSMAVQSSGSTLLVSNVYPASANNSGVWTGRDSGATFTPSAVPPAGSSGGNYMPTSVSILLNRIPANESVLSFDLARNPIPNDGTGDIGAYQYIPANGTLFFRRR